jgi:regulatory protein
MIPIRNKKKTLEVTVEEMRNFAFAYVEKYAPSKQQLKTYLLKKYLKISVSNVKKQDVINLIDIVLSDLEQNKFINDKFYSESKAKSMIQRGNSINKIRSYLIGKGINDQYIKDTVEKINNENSDQDFFSAIKLCKKKTNWPCQNRR